MAAKKSEQVTDLAVVNQPIALRRCLIHLARDDQKLLEVAQVVGRDHQP